ncbi:hypothetical protein CPB85DRAFT_1301761 [Mucidula mucida]|nr:hypothetical protein CPB85DRAFT_1301761 [Mucidula mucida]
MSLMFLFRLSASLKMWKHARSNETISVPPPPSDVTELQWARFLYGKNCQYCGPGPKKKLTRFFSLRKRVCAKCIAANLVSARPHIVLKKIPFASEEPRKLLVTVYPSTYDDDGIETLEIHSNYHWIPHIPAMMRELSEECEEVFFGSTRSTVSHAATMRLLKNGENTLKMS